MTIEHKIRRTPDEVCAPCPQNYEGECRAYSLPHSDAERQARTTGYGMECDESGLKRLRMARFGLKYQTV